MTNKEALSDLKNLYGDGSCEYVMRPLRTETIRLAIEALEKQIPMRPIHNHHCPNCGYGLPIKGITDDFCSCCFKQKHCPNCGQAIDWSEG